MTDKPKIYERNPITNTIRWRYLGEYLKNNIMTKKEENEVFTGQTLSESEEE